MKVYDLRAWLLIFACARVFVSANMYKYGSIGGRLAEDRTFKDSQPLLMLIQTRRLNPKPFRSSPASFPEGPSVGLAAS